MKALETLIPPPVIALLFALLMWWLHSSTPTLDMNNLFNVSVVSALLLIGVLFSFSGMLTFRRAKTTVNPKKPQEASTLVNTGIYQLTRNPMYLGLAFVLSGWAVFLNSLVSSFGVIGYMLYIHGFQILPEERALIKLLGEEYKAYQSRVRRWI